MSLNQSRLARQSNWVVCRFPRSQRASSRIHARLYALTGHRFMPRCFAGAPVMVLKIVGRRSGEKRCTPVLYLRDGDALVVLAANAGADRNRPGGSTSGTRGRTTSSSADAASRSGPASSTAPSGTAAGQPLSRCIHRPSSTPA